MKTKKKLRTSIPASGSFVSLPEAFPGAHPSVKYAPKIQLDTVRSDKSKHFQLEHVLLPHRILIDLQAVDASFFDAKTLVRDCEIVRGVALRHPKKLQQILEAFQEGAPFSHVEKAGAVVKELGLHERQVTRKGGGFISLLIILAALAASSAEVAIARLRKGIGRAGGADMGN
jgi:hypothetical protein